MKKLIFVLIFILSSLAVKAQSSAVNSGPSLPSVCITGSVYITTTNPSLNLCSSTNTWTTFSFIPSGTISLITTGTCSSGWTQVTALNGVMLRGTLAATGNVGQSGGNDSITPTVATLTAAAQTFTGNSVTSSAVSAGTPTGTNGTGTVTPLGTNGSVSITPLGTNAAITAGTPAGTISALTTGADSSTTGGVAKAIAQTPTFTGSALATHNHTFTGSSTTVGAQTFTGSSSVTSAEIFTGSAMSTHTHTTTATGSNGTSSVTGTMNSFDNRPAYLNVIFCSKD
jgi:hypothetical protein